MTIPMLAAHDDAGKIIFGIIFAVIWAISALISSINKKQQEARRRQVLTQAPPNADQELRQRQEAAQRHREQVRQQLERARALAQSRVSGPAGAARTAP